VDRLPAVQGDLMHHVDLGRQNPDCTYSRHGTYSAYKYGCRCPHAREDHRLYQKRRRQNRAQNRFVGKVGTVRRLQALAAMGWRWQDIGERMGVTWQSVQHLCLRSRPTVQKVTARRVQTIFRELAAVEGPSPITRRRALAKGWAPPHAWDNIDDPDETPNLGGVDGAHDEWAVLELLARRQTADAVTVDRVAEVDAVEAVRRMVAEGLRPQQIRYRLGLSPAHTRRLLQAAS
jgi:hypothetical protein